MVDVGATGQVVKETKLSSGDSRGEKKDDMTMADEGASKKAPKKEKEKGDYDVFLFSITAPRHRAPKQD